MGPEKLKKAEKLGVKVITEDDFVQLIGGTKELSNKGQTDLFAE
jgi:BRCT domain type II-containing protein